MANIQQTASASVPIKINRQNYYATLAINITGSLAQAWNGKEAIPDWETNPSLQPVLTPVVSCPKTFAYKEVKWYYNDSLVADQSGSKDARFEYIAGTRSLKIVKNLAAEDNPDPDTFRCDIIITLDNSDYAMSRAVSMQILPVSTDGYVAIMSAEPGTALSSTQTSATLTVKVFQGTHEVTSGLSYKWYKGNTVVGGTTNTYTVQRDDVNWEQLYRCEVLESASSTKALAVAALQITDQADNVALFAENKKDVTETDNGVVSVSLMKRATNADDWTAFVPAGATYEAYIYDVADSDKIQIVAPGTPYTQNPTNIAIFPEQMQNIVNGNVEIIIKW